MVGRGVSTRVLTTAAGRIGHERLQVPPGLADGLEVGVSTGAHTGFVTASTMLAGPRIGPRRETILATLRLSLMRSGAGNTPPPPAAPRRRWQNGDRVMRRLPVRDVVSLLASLSAVAATAALLRAAGRQRDHGRAGAAAGRARHRDARAAARSPSSSRCVAMLALNFFFLPPIGTFTIADPQNWIALVAFLDRRGHRQQSVGGGPGTRARGGGAPQRGDAPVRPDAGRAADDRDGRRHRVAGPARGAALRAGPGGDLPAGRTAAGASIRAASEEVAIDADVLNTALAKARGTLEFDARQRAYGGHVQRRATKNDVSIVPLRHGTQARSACWRPPSPDARHRRARRRRRRRRHRHRARAVPGRARRGGAGPAEGGPGGDAARVAQPRPADAADRDQGRRREPARRSARRTSAAGPGGARPSRSWIG